MKNRPWIWIVIAQLALMAALTTMVVIAHKYAQPEVPLHHGS